MGYKKGVRHGSALRKNEDIITAWKTSTYGYFMLFYTYIHYK